MCRIQKFLNRYLEISEDQVQRDGPRASREKKRSNKLKKMTALTSVEAQEQQWKLEGKETIFGRQFTVCPLHF